MKSQCSAPHKYQRTCIYAVDDDEDLIELYTTLLRTAGYVVRTFNDRVKALASLKEDRHKPQLLITDYRGHSMPVGAFLHGCIAAQPCLRILVASGFHLAEVDHSYATRNRLIQKPFTPQEFLHEVRATLVGSEWENSLQEITRTFNA